VFIFDINSFHFVTKIYLFFIFRIYILVDWLITHTHTLTSRSLIFSIGIRTGSLPFVVFSVTPVMSLFDSDNCKLEYEFQSIYYLIKKYAEIRDSNIQQLKRLKDFEIEIVILIDKINSLEDVLKESQISLEKYSNYDLSIDIVNSPLHVASDSKIMFV